MHLSWIADLGGWWDEISFQETRETGFLLARLDQLWLRVPRYKPLSVGVVLLDLVPASQHQPDLFAADNQRRQKLSPLIDRINDRYGRCTIGFGLLPPEVRAFKGHAAFQRVPESGSFRALTARLGDPAKTRGNGHRLASGFSSKPMPLRARSRFTSATNSFSPSSCSKSR